MSIPAVASIRTQFLDAHISWLVEGSTATFLADQNFIDEVITFPRRAISEGIRKGRCSFVQNDLTPFVSQLRKHRYDLIVDFHGIAKSVLLSMLARKGKSIGFGRMFAKEKSHLFYDDKINGGDRRMHKVERNMLLARHLGFGDIMPEPVLRVSGDAIQYIDGFFLKMGNPSPLFAVNPFSSKGTDFKRWPLEQYGELISRIHDGLHGQTVIIWGPGEEEDARRLQGMAPEASILACPTNISQLYALLRRIDVYVGGDTGVMHLAAAAKIPVVAIFGPTDAKINGPYGTAHTIIKKDVPCSPCKKKDCRQRDCLVNISVEEVYKTVSIVYNKRSETN